jgi:hypothetical protein
MSIQSNTTGNTQTGGTWTTVSGASTSHTPSTSAFTRVSVTGTVPTNAKGLAFYIGQNVGLGNGSIYYVALAKVEIGSTPTTWSRLSGTIQGELAACQRYYWRSTPGNYFGNYAVGMAGSATLAYVALKLPVTMRIIPTAIEVNSTITALKLTNIVSTNWTISAIGLTDSTFDSLMLAVTASGMTTNQALVLGNNNNLAAFIGASAEL